MFVRKNIRKCLICAMGFMFLVGMAESARASCDIKQVCEQVKIKQKKNKSLTDPIREEIESFCDDKMHKTDCPIDDVIQACWDGGEKEAHARCP